MGNHFQKKPEKHFIIDDIVDLFEIGNKLEEEHLKKELYKLTKHGASTLYHYMKELTYKIERE